MKPAGEPDNVPNMSARVLELVDGVDMKRFVN